LQKHSLMLPSPHSNPGRMTFRLVNQLFCLRLGRRYRKRNWRDRGEREWRQGEQEGGNLFGETCRRVYGTPAGAGIARIMFDHISGREHPLPVSVPNYGASFRISATVRIKVLKSACLSRWAETPSAYQPVSAPLLIPPLAATLFIKSTTRSSGNPKSPTSKSKRSRSHSIRASVSWGAQIPFR
jgi:hypothetical protein